MKYLIPLLLICNALFFTACKSNISKENGKNNNTTNETEEADEEAPGGWLKQNFEMTKDPALGYVPYERLAVAQAYTQSLINSRTVNTNSLAWTERGPSNVGGRTRAILIDKRDATGNTVFAGSVGGGIWKCTNFKSTEDWQFFSLYFEPIPQKDCILNMIESEKPTTNDFNYYGIALKMEEGIGVIPFYL